MSQWYIHGAKCLALGNVGTTKLLIFDGTSVFQAWIKDQEKAMDIMGYCGYSFSIGFQTLLT